MDGPPVIVLGVSRSGTTLLKEMLDRHPALALPTESYFVPQLMGRHGPRGRLDAVIADVGRLARVREWGVAPEEVRARVSPGADTAAVVRAVYEAYAERRGKRRYGDKTPSYMQELPLLERVFPDARYVHIVRDGRDACLSFLGMRRRPRFNWSRPRGPGGFACQWRLEVEGARRFGRTTAAGRYVELRYEDLVAAPEARLRELCGFLGLEYDPAMLEYHRTVDRERLQDHPALERPPTPGLRSWRDQMGRRQVARFDAIAGSTLRACGYDVEREAGALPRLRALAERAVFRARVGTWRLALAVVRRSPAWRLRQRYIRRTA